jgi:hypothetical protein
MFIHDRRTLPETSGQPLDPISMRPGRRLCAGRRWLMLVVGNAQDIPF